MLFSIFHHARTNNSYHRYKPVSTMWNASMKESCLINRGFSGQLLVQYNCNFGAHNLTCMLREAPNLGQMVQIFFYWGTCLAPFFNCLIQNGDLGGEVELINLPLIFVVYCSNYNGAPVKMVSFSTVPPPPVESETLHGRLKRGAG